MSRTESRPASGQTDAGLDLQEQDWSDIDWEIDADELGVVPLAELSDVLVGPVARQSPGVGGDAVHHLHGRGR